MHRSILIVSTLLGGLALAQVTPVRVGKKGVFSWDAPTTNEDGTPLTDLAGYRAAVAAVGADLNGSDIPIAETEIAGTTVTQVELKTLMSGEPDGQYSLWVSAHDDVGNDSLWAGPVAIEYDQRGPDKPKNPKAQK